MKHLPVCALLAAIAAGCAVVALADPSPSAPAKPASTHSDAPAPKPFPEINATKKLWAAKDFRGKAAPKLEVEKWLTTQPDTKGKVVLIDFWATWCKPCVRLMPELDAWQKTFKDDLVVIGVSDDPEAKVTKLLKDKPVAYAMAIDAQARTKEAIGVIGIPHVLVIDSTGIVRWQGFPDMSDDPLNEQVIRQIIEADKSRRVPAAAPARPAN